MVGSGQALANPFDQRFARASGTVAPPPRGGPSAGDGHRRVPRVTVDGDRDAAVRLLAVDHVLVGTAVVRETSGAPRPVRGRGVLLVPQCVPEVARQVRPVSGGGDGLGTGTAE